MMKTSLIIKLMDDMDDMMAVYMNDSSHGAVKIVERNNIFYVYVLKEVQIDSTQKPVKWVFENKARNKWLYKPYEDNDVLYSPDGLLSYICRWTQHKVRRV